MSDFIFSQGRVPGHQSHEDPWDRRQPNTEDYQWFQNLLDQHELTLEWLRILKMDQDATPHHLKRVLSPAVHNSLWILEKLTRASVPADLESLLDDSRPSELLSNIEYTTWAVQAWTMANILRKTPEQERSAMRNVLERSSWKAGRHCCQRRWPRFIPRVGQDLKRDLRWILAAFRNSPFSGYPSQNSFLVKRATSTELQLELLCCPHQSRYLEVQTVADELCYYHTHWMRGFAYALNPSVIVEYTPLKRDPFQPRKGNPRCLHKWGFQPGE